MGEKEKEEHQDPKEASFEFHICDLSLSTPPSLSPKTKSEGGGTPRVLPTLSAQPPPPFHSPPLAPTDKGCVNCQLTTTTVP